jgi:hypothetical protein
MDLDAVFEIEIDKIAGLIGCGISDAKDLSRINDGGR